MKKSTQARTVGAKIAKVKKDHPEKSNKQAAGMAYGMLREEGMRLPKKQSKKPSKQ